MPLENMAYAPSMVGWGQAKPLDASDLEQKTVVAGTEVTVYSKQVPNDKLFYWGYGGKNRQAADTKFMFADLVATGNGDGTAGDPITGDLIVAITDSDQNRVLASWTLGALGELADARGDDRTERPVQFALDPYAKPGRHIELRVKAKASSDGYEIDNTEDPGTASSARLWRSEVN
ncbi:hypothetical protein [Salinigranum sp. GCM10025319]|uniref:hypothetical protein n=1 Tax=Salinigranum sp. GCM10025319 TaxID=3252687 RepID=UPI0036178B81